MEDHLGHGEDAGEFEASLAGVGSVAVFQGGSRSDGKEQTREARE